MDYSKKGIFDKQQEVKSISTRVVSKVRVILFRILLVAFVFVAIVACFAIYGGVKGIIDDAPALSQININPEGFTTTIYYSDGSVSGKLVGAESNRVEVSISQVPDVLQKCFVALEDERFYEHNGIDIRGIFRAGYSVLKEGDLGYGASTIDQQLLKNRVFNNGDEANAVDKIERKIQEQYLAVQLEHAYTKDEIMIAYLNTINLGNRSYGVEMAAQNYFGKHVWQLNLSESAVIAAIALSPVYRNPITNPEKNAERRQACLENMLAMGYCTKAEYDEAINDDVYSRIKDYSEQNSTSDETYYTYFQDEVTNEIMEDLQSRLGYTSDEAYNILYSGGLSIYTTQDKDIQDIVDKEYCDESNFPALGNATGSFYELTPGFAVSILHSDQTQTHYHLEDLENYYADYDDSDLIFYHENYTSDHKGISNYTTDTDKMDAMIDEFINSVMSEGDSIAAEVKYYTLEPQSSIVIMDQYTGSVVAIYGGRGEKTGSLTLNRATTTLRQVGSTFKVLASFLPALDTCGMTLATVADDSKYFYPGTTTEVNNWNGDVYKGLSSIRDAICHSMNIVACRIMERVTPQVSFDYLEKLGFTTLVESRTDSDGKTYSDIGIPLALGGLTDGVTNLELCAGYATIASGGVYNKPMFYTKVVDHNGNTILENDTAGTQVIKNSTAFLLTDAMVDVTTDGTGTKLAFKSDEVNDYIKEYARKKLGLKSDETSDSQEYKDMVSQMESDLSGMKVAGKTGTTHDYTDLWFVGFTTHYTASIWTGFDNNISQIDKSYHQNMWRKIMEEIHVAKEDKAEDFTIPDSIVTAKICTKCGNLAVEGLCDEASQASGSTTRTEYFAKGTVPTQKCTCHVKVSICKDSGMLAGPGCPTTSVIEKVYLKKTETSPTWDTPYILPSNLGVCTLHNSAGTAASDDGEGNSNADDTGAGGSLSDSAGSDTSSEKTVN